MVKVAICEQHKVVSHKHGDDQQLLYKLNVLGVGPEQKHYYEVLRQYNQVFPIDREGDLLMYTVAAGVQIHDNLYINHLYPAYLYVEQVLGDAFDRLLVHDFEDLRHLDNEGASDDEVAQHFGYRELEALSVKEVFVQEEGVEAVLTEDEPLEGFGGVG